MVTHYLTHSNVNINIQHWILRISLNLRFVMKLPDLYLSCDKTENREATAIILS